MQILAMNDEAPAYQCLSPEGLRRLVESSTWIFETGTIESQGEQWRAPEFYAQAMALVGTNNAADREGAISKFSALLQHVPVFSEGHFQLSRLYLHQDQLDLSLKFARNAAAMMPGNLTYQTLFVAVLAASGKLPEAKAVVEKCLELLAKPFDSFAADEDAVARFLAENLSLVLSSHIFADGKLQPVDAYLVETLRMFESREPAKVQSAAANLEHFLKVRPSFSEARFWLAEYERRQGNEKRALELCEDGRRFVLDWPLLIEAGVLLWGAGRRNSALFCFEEAALINHDLPIFSPQHIDEKSAIGVSRWYSAILDDLRIGAGNYGAGWKIGNPPEIHVTIPRNSRPFRLLINDGLRDLTQALTRAPAWWMLARNDLTARYRRTALGPWWLVLSSAIALVGMAAVWSLIFNMNMTEFFPYLSAGYAVWLLLNSVIVEGCGTFTDGPAAMVQKNLDLPKFLHVFRLVTRNFLLFAHTVTIFIVGAVVFGVPVTFNTLWVVPGLALLYLNAIWLVVLLGLIGARFRDFAPAVSAFMTVVFFLTPVLWKAEMLRDHAHVAEINPFTHLIAIVREPLLGAAPSATSWTVAVMLCLIGWAAALLIFSWLRQRVVFWL